MWWDYGDGVARSARECGIVPAALRRSLLVLSEVEGLRRRGQPARRSAAPAVEIEFGDGVESAAKGQKWLTGAGAFRHFR